MYYQRKVQAVSIANKEKFMIWKLVLNPTDIFKKSTIVIALFFSVGLNAVHSQTSDAPKENQVSIIDKLKIEFRKRNPNIAFVRIVDVRPTLTEMPKYLVLGWGIRADRAFKGSFEDELFGVFLVDESLNKVEKVIDFIPTPRWLDTEARIASIDATKAIIKAKGETYGGVLLQREYIMYNYGRISPLAYRK
jgi:hypothetical protein